MAAIVCESRDWMTSSASGLVGVAPKQNHVVVLPACSFRRWIFLYQRKACRGPTYIEWNLILLVTEYIYIYNLKIGNVSLTVDRIPTPTIFRKK